ncbi:MAG TPA: hypothetical protein VK504_21325, partial [Vicinamibacterales bacterium]|nr:hypothetical protein [Vicinamibacterales bacterium]
MNPIDLETRIDRTLRRFPAPRAPRTLLPRVLAAVQEWSQRPWYSRAWFAWPIGGQIVSAAALILVVIGAAFLTMSAQAAVDQTAARLLGGVMPVAQRAEAMLNAARVVWHAVVEPLAVYAFAVVAVMFLAC